jgi:amidase
VAYPHVEGPQAGRVLTIDGETTPYHEQFAWPGIASWIGLPATAAPVGRDADNLPLGVQIIGPYLADRTTIAVAGWLAESMR